jgi:hypothetical protein
MKVPALRIVVTSILLVLILGMAGSVQTVRTATQTKEPIQLDSHVSMLENLLALKGKSVTVTFAGGQITGIVKDANNGIIHLEKLSQKDFYDAIIRIDQIVALEARVR